MRFASRLSPLARQRVLVALAVFAVAVLLPTVAVRSGSAFSASTTDVANLDTAADFTAGTLYRWGEVVDGSPERAPTPLGVPGTWTGTALGYRFACAVRADGTLWCWGDNGSGQLGVGDTAPRSGPTRVGSDQTWRTVTAGRDFACATRYDGTAWCWGGNADHQLGQGLPDTTDRSTPTQVGTDTWSVLSSGRAHTCGIRSTGGTLWCWGDSTAGQGGQGGATQLGVPAQVGVAAWTAVGSGVDHTCAVRSDGTLWCFGANASAELGTGAPGQESTPVRVGVATDWSAVSAGDGATCGLRAPGTLWCWGANGQGQAGVGDTTLRQTPAQVGAGSTWRTVSLGADFACGTTVGPVTWCWGSNAAGQLGIDQAVPMVTGPAEVPFTGRPVQLGPMSRTVMALR